MLGVNYAYTLYLPSMVRNLTSLNDSIVGYIISGMGLFGAFGMIFNAALSDRSRKPYRHMILPAILEAICLFTVSFTIGPWLAVPVLAIMYFAHNAIQGPLLALPSTFLHGKGAAAGLAPPSTWSASSAESSDHPSWAGPATSLAAIRAAWPSSH